MRRMSAQIVLWLVVLLFAAGMGTAASEVGFSGSVGLDITYTPVPPASYNIGSDLTLAFSVSGFTFTSATGFDLYGFQSEAVTLAVDLGAVQISEEIRFEPHFTWNELSVDLSIVGVQIGFDLILADIVGPQTPTYSMGAVLELSSGIVCGVTITSLTGFGAEDLVNLLGGIEAPFSYELLYLFNHLAGLCDALGQPIPEFSSYTRSVDVEYVDCTGGVFGAAASPPSEHKQVTVTVSSAMGSVKLVSIFSNY